MKCDKIEKNIGKSKVNDKNIQKEMIFFLFKNKSIVIL